MLHLALAALLAGFTVLGGPDDDKDKDKGKVYRAESAVVDQPVANEDDAIINDTYALGRSERIPIKLWLGYARAADDVGYDANGEEFDLPYNVNAQRAFVGAQLNVINFPSFSVGVGGQLTAAQNELENTPLGTLDSGFKLQNGKVYGILRGSTLGVHGGFIFDLGPDGTTEELAAEGETTNSDQVDAWFVGVDFDYPSERFRLFAGIDYFNRDELANQVTSGAIEDDEIVVFNAGAGIRIAFVELGAAALLRTNIAINRLGTPTGGGHQGSIVPYLILSPQSFPVSLSVKGAVLSEYADYGYAIGGASDLKTTNGFTVTASLGF